MALDVKQLDGGKILEVCLSGKLAKEDYDHFVPLTESLIAAEGKIRLLVEMHDFHGWEMSALWADIKFDCQHFRDIERLALVGESKWEQGMAAFCKPFTAAEIRYFDAADLEQARAWIQSA